MYGLFPESTQAYACPERAWETPVRLEQPTLLVVEDDPGHARLIERNLRRAALPYVLVFLGDGQAVFDYFAPAWDAGSARPFPPCLVLLDLHLPGRSGIEVLARLKSDPQTRRIPVIVFTTTDDPGEIAYCYALGCNAYVTKPVAYDQFVTVLRHLSAFLAVIALPPATASAAGP
jgi:CheY-like chemotaxis protein